MSEQHEPRDITLMALDQPDGSVRGVGLERHPPAVNNGRLSMEIEVARFDLPAGSVPGRPAEEGMKSAQEQWPGTPEADDEPPF